MKTSVESSNFLLWFSVLRDVWKGPRFQGAMMIGFRGPFYPSQAELETSRELMNTRSESMNPFYAAGHEQ
jgi:hypothetical protein